MSVNYTRAPGNAGYLTHRSRPGIEPSMSRFLVGFISATPQQEFCILPLKQTFCLSKFERHCSSHHSDLCSVVTFPESSSLTIFYKILSPLSHSVHIPCFFFFNIPCDFRTYNRVICLMSDFLKI